MRTKIKLGIVAAIVAFTTVLTGCQGKDNFRDVEGVKSQRPDVIENFNNMDQHPNIGLVCIHGAGFATTTRDFTSLVRVEKWDAYCESRGSH